jgi:hypothetical protein
VPKRCYLTFFHIPERSIALVTTGWFTKDWVIEPATLTKCYSKVAHAFLYTLMDFFQSHQTVPKPLLSYLLPFSRTFNCTSKTTGWFTKGEIDPNLPHANKVLLQVARILIYIDGLLSVAPNCAQAVAILPSSIFERSIALVTTGWFKRAEIDPNLPHANKVLLKVAHAFLYTLMDFFQSHKLCPSLSYLLPYPTFTCSKTTGWFTKRRRIDPNLPR